MRLTVRYFPLSLAGAARFARIHWRFHPGCMGAHAMPTTPRPTHQVDVRYYTRNAMLKEALIDAVGRQPDFVNPEEWITPRNQLI
jgi:hypothetical protein